MGKLRKRPSVESSDTASDGDDSMNGSVSNNSRNHDSAISKEGSLDFGDAFNKEKDLEDKAQEVMKSNLDLMREVVMKIREDPDYASSIYDDCPRLQQLLDENPDLRPIFEDPKLVRINFEQVYRNAGGTLPEDPPPKKERIKKCIGVIVNHPLFKFLKFLMVIKKVVSFVVGGGISQIRNVIKGVFGACFGSDGLDIDADLDEGFPENRPNKVALNKAADHMEKPEVQEKMSAMMADAETDPDSLQEAIEADKELKALRDSNPLCSELMSDPDQMRILTEPDNLRALGEAPDLIQQDFMDPDWVSPDDIEAQANFDVMETVPEEGFEGGDADFEFDFEGDGEDLELDEGLEGEPEVEKPELEEPELEEEEGGIAEDFEMGEDEGKEGGNDNKNKSRSAGKNQQKKRGQEAEGGDDGGGGGGLISNFATGLKDYVAGEVVGAVMGDLGGGDDFGGLEDFEEPPVDGMADLGGLEDFEEPPLDDIPVDDMADAADAAEEGANTLTEKATEVVSNIESVDALTEGDALDNVDKLEEHMDTIEEKHDEMVEKEEEAQSAARAITGGVAVGGVAAVAGSRSVFGDDDDDDGGDDEEPEKKSRFGLLGSGLSAISAAAKEQMAVALLGDDLGEMLLEEMEEDEDEEDDDEEQSDAEDNSSRKEK